MLSRHSIDAICYIRTESLLIYNIFANPIIIMRTMQFYHLLFQIILLHF
jgi:hypothetical protein